MRQIRIGGKNIGRLGQPAVCVPLVGRTRGGVVNELAAILPQEPDLIEWRVDSFEGIGSIRSVIELAVDIKAAARDIPIIFTCRAVNEGGGLNALNDSDILKLYVAACASHCVDLIDYEISNPTAHLMQLRDVSRDNAMAMIMSYHDHHGTPAESVMLEKFLEAERLGADVAKVVVMPRQLEDVLTLLGATLKASRQCEIPLVGVAMGQLGFFSRILGWAYGSAMTFAINKAHSVPGLIPVAEMRSVLASVHRVAQSA